MVKAWDKRIERSSHLVSNLPWWFPMQCGIKEQDGILHVLDRLPSQVHYMAISVCLTPTYGFCAALDEDPRDNVDMRVRPGSCGSCDYQHAVRTQTARMIQLAVQTAGAD
jgi:hypothetical protein